LQRISILSSGRLGSVNQADLTLNQQPRSLFGLSDIQSGINLAENHNPAPGSPAEYSQAVRVSTNAFVGVDAELPVVERDSTTSPIFSNPVHVSHGGAGDPTKTNSGVDGVFDGSIQSQQLTLDSALNSFIGTQFTLGDLQSVEVGLCATIPTFNASILFAIAGTYIVKISGSQVATGSYIAGDIFSIRYYRGIPSNGAVFLKNDETIASGNLAAGDTLTPYYLFATNGEGLIGVSVANYSGAITTGKIRGGYGRRFLAGVDAIDDVDSEILYTQQMQEFRVIAKGGNYIEVDIPIFLRPGSAGIYRAKYQTSQPVTGVELTLRFSLFARNSDGELIDHGQAFKILIGRGEEPLKNLGGFFISSKREKGTRRSLIVTNLPLGKYSIQLEPLTKDMIVDALPRIGEGATLTTVGTGEFYDGAEIQLQYASIGSESAAIIRQLIGQTENSKIQTSNEQGATGILTHVNERTNPESIGYPAIIRYKNYSQIYTSVLASDRLQSAPEEGHAIDQGAEIRQYLSYGRASSSSTATQLDDVNAHFIDDGVAVGASVRILETGQNRVITARTQLSLTLSVFSNQTATLTVGSALATVSTGVFSNARVGMPVNGLGIAEGAYIIEKIGTDTLCFGDEWGRELPSTQSGDRQLTFNSGPIPTIGAEYVVFSVGASPYFPDIYVDRLINPIDGLGNFVNQDHFIDYESICYSRQFCKANDLFYEAIITGESFEAWATESAPSSLLFVTKIDGRFALIPEQDQPISGIYNAGNVIEYSEPYVPWVEQNINTVLAKYSDRDGRDRQVKVLTDEANSTGVEIQQTIDLSGVKSPAQAELIAIYALNSIRNQTRICQITSDIETLNIRQGDLIRTQHVITEYSTQSSGKILGVGALTNTRTAQTAVITTIKSIIPGSGNTAVITTLQPHQLREGDSVVISGSGISGTYTPTIFDPIRFSVPTPFVSNNSGTIRRSRTVWDQTVVLSGVTSLPQNYRISIGRQASAQVDLVIQDLGDRLNVIGVEAPIEVGSVYCLGEDSPLDRTWRVSRIQPDITQNKTEVDCVLWSPNLGSDSGLVVIN
jgi:hypothetical protein